MKKLLMPRLSHLLLALGLMLPFGVSPGMAQEACWDNSAIQSALAEGRILPVATVLQREGIDPSTEVLSVKVCDEGGTEVYVLAVLEASGQARNLTLNAK